MNILIVKLGSIGDIVHTLPSLAAIRAQVSNSRIFWAVEKRSAEILRGNPLIDELIEVDTQALRKLRGIDDALPEITTQVRQMRKLKLDIALDFQGLMKSGAIAKLSGAKRRWGFSRASLREPASRMFLTDTAVVPGQSHVILKNLELVRQALSIPIPTENFEFPIETSAEDKAEALDIAREAGHRFAVLNPAGGWITKLWPAESFGQLADRLWLEMGMRSVVVTGPKESTLASVVRSASRTDSIIFSEPSLKVFYELARLSSLYVGGDTGPTHLAVAAGAPLVGLFGPTEWWRNGSPDPNDICVERTDIGCRIDCHRRRCSNWICMNSDVETVYMVSAQRVARERVTV